MQNRRSHFLSSLPSWLGKTERAETQDAKKEAPSAPQEAEVVAALEKLDLENDAPSVGGGAAFLAVGAEIVEGEDLYFKFMDELQDEGVVEQRILQKDYIAGVAPETEMSSLLTLGPTMDVSLMDAAKVVMGEVHEAILYMMSLSSAKFKVVGRGGAEVRRAVGLVRMCRMCTEIRGPEDVQDVVENLPVLKEILEAAKAYEVIEARESVALCDSGLA